MVGLDPYPAVLHSLDYGRHALPLDLVDEFRTLVADTLTLSLFNLGILKQGDFEFVAPAEPSRQEGEADSVRFYRLCDRCQRKVLVSGLGLKVTQIDFMIA